MTDQETSGVYGGRAYRLRVSTFGPPPMAFHAATGETTAGPDPDPPVWGGAWAELPGDGSPLEWIRFAFRFATADEALAAMQHEIVVERAIQARFFPDDYH
jgi:hypothetical protein